MILCFDIGATGIKTGIFNNNSGTFFEEKEFKTVKNFNSFVTLINQIISDYRTLFDFKNIAIGFPGIIKDRGEIIFSPNLPFLINANIFEIIENSNKFFIKFENDANCAALGAKTVFKKKDIVAITLGTGIGGGVILNGKLVKNSRKTGFEFGHITVKENGAICGCGKEGCLEAYSSATGMIKNFNKLCSKSVENFEELFKISQNQLKAREVINKGFFYLGIGSSIIANIFAPELMVFTGGIAKKFTYFKDVFEESFHKYTLPFIKEKMEISIYNENNIGLLGAATLFL